MAKEGSALLRAVRDAIRVRHYSYRTGKAYVDWVRRYVLFRTATISRSEFSGKAKWRPFCESKRG